MFLTSGGTSVSIMSCFRLNALSAHTTLVWFICSCTTTTVLNTVFHTRPSPLILCHSSLSHILESCLATSPPTTPVLCQLIPHPLINIKLFQIFSDMISPSHSGPMCRAALRQPTKQYLLGQSVVIYSCQVAQLSQTSRYNYIFQGSLHSKLAGHLDTTDELSPLLC